MVVRFPLMDTTTSRGSRGATCTELAGWKKQCSSCRYAATLRMNHKGVLKAPVTFRHHAGPVSLRRDLPSFQLKVGYSVAGGDAEPVDVGQAHLFLNG